MARRWKIKKYKANLKKMKKVLPMKLGKIMEFHFVKSFKDKGFTDVSLSPWEKRKTRRANPLMVDTGKLVRSIKVRSASFTRVRVGTYTTDYASYHNKGIGKQVKREFIGSSRVMTKKINKEIKKELKNIFK